MADEPKDGVLDIDESIASAEETASKLRAEIDRLKLFEAKCTEGGKPELAKLCREGISTGLSMLDSVLETKRKLKEVKMYMEVSSIINKHNLQIQKIMDLMGK